MAILIPVYFFLPLGAFPPPGAIFEVAEPDILFLHLAGSFSPNQAAVYFSFCCVLLFDVDFLLRI